MASLVDKLTRDNSKLPLTEFGMGRSFRKVVGAALNTLRDIVKQFVNPNKDPNTPKDPTFWDTVVQPAIDANQSKVSQPKNAQNNISSFNRNSGKANSSKPPNSQLQASAQQQLIQDMQTARTQQQNQQSQSEAARRLQQSQEIAARSSF
jgi:hypothetical protein